MNVEDILIAGILLLPPLVLWRCKRFCEKHPSTVPFRTVPMGCMTMVLTMTLFESAVAWLFKTVLERNIPHSLSAWGGRLSLLLALFLGLAAIVLLSKRLARDGRPPPGWLYPAVFLGLAAIAMTVSVCWQLRRGIIPDLRDFDKESVAWDTIYLPKVQDCPIAFEVRPSHPFLAEYDYRIRLGERKSPTYFRLWANTGGRTFLNVYRVAQDKLLLKDTYASYLVDVARRQVYLVASEPGSDESGQEVHSAVPLSEKEFDMRTADAVGFVDGTSAEAVSYDADLRSREYIGCIMDYSFYTPDEQPEGEGHPRYRKKD